MRVFVMLCLAIALLLLIAGCHAATTSTDLGPNQAGQEAPVSPLGNGTANATTDFPPTSGRPSVTAGSGTSS